MRRHIRKIIIKKRANENFYAKQCNIDYEVEKYLQTEEVTESYIEIEDN